jgi:TRAP-type mannitol/chloroaromatic compound transport system permease small subunit
MTASVTLKAPVDEAVEPIHVSVASLTCGVVGFALWGVGSLVRAGSLENVQVAEALEVVGPLLIALAIILHVDHLSSRIGRTAVVLLIIGPIVYGISRIPALFEAEGIGWFRYEYASYGAGHLLVGLGILMVAVHKETQMKAALEHYASNQGGAPPEITVHASFVSLLSAAGGLILVAISEFNDIGGHPRTRFDFILRSVGALLITLGIVTHIDHLTRRIGLAAVVVGILASLCWFGAYLPRVYNPSFDFDASWSDVKWVLFGCAYLLAALAGALVLMRKLRLER